MREEEKTVKKAAQKFPDATFVPQGGLAWHEWTKHGSCNGFGDAKSYFKYTYELAIDLNSVLPVFDANLLSDFKTLHTKISPLISWIKLRSTNLRLIDQTEEQIKKYPNFQTKCNQLAGIDIIMSNNQKKKADKIKKNVERVQKEVKQALKSFETLPTTLLKLPKYSKMLNSDEDPIEDVKDILKALQGFHTKFQDRCGVSEKNWQDFLYSLGLVLQYFEGDLDEALNDVQDDTNELKQRFDEVLKPKVTATDRLT